MEILSFKEVYGKFLKILMVIFTKWTKQPGLVKGALGKGVRVPSNPNHSKVLRESRQMI